MGKKINDRGMAVIVLAIGMIVLVGFVGLAVDIGYMYVAKGQLQNAADAAALAGAAKLKRSDVPIYQQYSARSTAIAFGLNNKAAASPVVIASDIAQNSLSSPTTSGGNDITSGHWTPVTGYQEGTTPINAIKVRARRTVPGTTSDNQGQIRIFFGKIFALLPGGGAGWPFMSASAEAVAIKQPFIGPFPICVPSCVRDTPLEVQWDYQESQSPYEIYCTDATGSPPGQLFEFNSSNTSEVQKRPGIAWTNFCTTSCPGSCTTPTSGDVTPYLTGTPPPDVCGQYIRTTNGNITGLLPTVQALLAANSKPYTFNVSGTNVTVTGWAIFIPVVSDTSCGGASQACPGDPGGNPYLVLQYAKVLVTEVQDTSKHGIRLVGFSNPRTLTVPGVSCSGPPRTFTLDRRVTSITCTNCADNLDTTGMAGIIKLVKP